MFVFGTACTLGLPLVALYGLIKYVEASIDWGRKLIDKLDKYNKMASNQNTSRFKELVELYGLTKDDFFKAPQGFIIVTRTGVEKIQYDLGCPRRLRPGAGVHGRVQGPVRCQGIR